MTKEKFLSNIGDMCTYGGDILVLNEFAKEFFDSNVCIPKGQQRHKYAEVLHEWVEGAEIQKIDLGKQWLDIKDVIAVMSQLGIKDGEYRIKPSEPVYEWQWYVVSNDTKEPRLIGWNTEEEREKDTFWSSGVYRMEETKRVRNA